MLASDDVGIEVQVTIDGADPGHGRPTVLRLGWCRPDPLAVTMALRGQPDHPALFRGSWVVLRDFLRYGLEQATGDGDVRIEPDPVAGAVALTLGRHGPRPATVRLPAATLSAFLDATEAVVPSGEERSAEALDALIEQLLRR